MTPIKITPKLLGELIRYEPETGKLFWKERDVRFFKNAGAAFIWNADNVGKEIAWKYKPNRYRSFQIFGEAILVHRAAWAIQYGEWPENNDHINGQRHDSRLCNLRDVNDVLNGRNKVMLSTNTSGHTGVQKTKGGKYIAKILKKHIGTFDTFEDAVKARQETQAVTPGFTERHGKPRIIDLGFSGLTHQQRRSIYRQAGRQSNA